MDHELATEDNTRILSVGQKTIDIENIAEFRDLLEKHATESDTNLILCLDKVEYLGSVALGMISLASVMVDKRGGHFVVVCENDSILKLFVMSGLYRVLKIVNDIPAALSHIAAAAS